MKMFFFCLLISPTVLAADFEISGLKIGNKVHDVHAYGFCLPPEGVITECLNITQLAGGKALITYYFEGDVLKDATIIFDSKKYGKLVSLYEKILGQEPEITKEPIEFDSGTRTNKVAKWRTPSGELTIKKYRSEKKGFAYLKVDQPG